MKTSPKAIIVTDTQSLKREKARLKRLCNEMEEEGRERIGYIRKNYGAMAFNSIFPNAHPETEIWKLAAQAAKSAWGSTHFRSVLISALIAFLEFFGVRQAVKLVEKIFKKKETEKQRD